MPFKKGQSGNKKGKPKGAVNKATADARESIALFVDGNAHRLQKWLDQIALESPEKAFNCFYSLIEYHIPKLARTEATVEHSGKVTFTAVTRRIVDERIDNQHT